MPLKKNKGLKRRIIAKHEEKYLRGPSFPKALSVEFSVSPNVNQKLHLLLFTLLCGDQENYLNSGNNKESNLKSLEQLISIISFFQNFRRYITFGLAKTCGESMTYKWTTHTVVHVQFVLQQNNSRVSFGLFGTEKKGRTSS